MDGKLNRELDAKIVINMDSSRQQKFNSQMKSLKAKHYIEETLGIKYPRNNKINLKNPKHRTYIRLLQKGYKIILKNQTTESIDIDQFDFYWEILDEISITLERRYQILDANLKINSLNEVIKVVNRSKRQSHNDSP